MAQTFNSLFEHELKKLCEEEIARLAENLVHGAAIDNIADYKHATGQIAGLRKIVDLCADANTNLADR